MTNEADLRTIPLYEEQVSVAKTQVVTDHLRVSTVVEARPVLIEDVIERGDLHVERFTVERAVAELPAPRQDGQTLIVSIVEERLVVEKRMFVIEELHITRTGTTEHIAIPETVRTMRASIERIPAPSPSTGIEQNG